MGSLDAEPQYKRIRVVEADAVYHFSDADQKIIDHISRPSKYTHEEWARVRGNFVNNGLSHGIEDYEYPDVANFSYDAKGPSETPKFSKNYADCTGVVVVGTRKDGLGEVSVMTHGAPQKILNSPDFESWFRNLCREIKEQVHIDSIQAEIFGGRDMLSSSAIKQLQRDQGSFQDNGYSCLKKNYDESVSLLTGLLEEELGISPVKTVGPNREVGTLDIYFDTSNRTMYAVRPRQSLMETSLPLQDEVMNQIKNTFVK